MQRLFRSPLSVLLMLAGMAVGALSQEIVRFWPIRDGPVHKHALRCLRLPLQGILLRPASDTRAPCRGSRQPRRADQEMGFSAP